MVQHALRAGRAGLRVAAVAALVVATAGVGVVRAPDAAAAAVVIQPVAGSGVSGSGGDGGPALAAQFVMPAGLSLAGGELAVADSAANRVRVVSASGQITALAGTGASGFSGDGGPATSATLWCPTDVDYGGFYALIVDACNHRIRQVVNGTITTVAGTGSTWGLGDGGPATAADLNYPTDVEYSPAGYLVADSGHSRVRAFLPGMTISTFAGNGTSATAGDGGPATAASLQCPTALAVAPTGEVYIGDPCAYRVRKVDTAGVITTVAGNGTPGASGDGGPAALAQLSPALSGLAVDANGILYIADGNRIRAVVPGGTIVTVAGTGQPGSTGDGGPAALATLSAGFLFADRVDDEVYVGDYAAHRVRKIGTYTPTVADPVPAPSGFPSDSCGGPVLAGRTAGPTTLRVTSAAPDPNTRHVCVRADAPGLGTGGRFEVTAPGAGLAGTPSVDEQAGACAATPGNTVPGPHPAFAATVGDPSDPATYVPVALDTFASGSEVWTCVRLGSQAVRVKVPVGAAVVPPTVTFVPDSAGPHAAPVGPHPAMPSGSCAAGVPVLDAAGAGGRAAVYASTPSGTSARLCVRTEGALAVGGALFLDAGGAGGAVPTVTTSSDLTPCTVQVAEVTSPALVRVRRSAGTSPASICVWAGTDAVRVTVGPGSGGTPANVTWSPDPGTPGLP